uniref:Receptor for retinol uptake STRA6 n=1 Tax=Eptatretus burgeri TaxID=7764 RepID=A0A8C4WZ37_EPTBU
VWYPEGLPDRRVFAAAFGLLVCAFFRVTLEDQPLPFITSQKQHKELLMVAAFLYYGVLYFPLLACAQISNRNAHVLGCLFSWVYLGSLVSQKMQCPRTSMFYAHYSLLAAFPQILCLLYLSIKYPLLIYNDFANESEFGNNQKMCCLQSHQLEYVQQLFKLLTFTLAQVALLSTVLLVPLLQKVRSGVDTDIAYVLASFGLVLSPDNNEVVKIFKHFLWTTEGSLAILSLHYHSSNKYIKDSTRYININCLPCPQGTMCVAAFILKTIVFFSCAVLLSFTLIVPPMHSLAALALNPGFSSRRLFFITTYLLFCYNVLVGFVVCISRICVSALYNILHIARLDVTLLNTHVALHDPGHRSYIQFLQLEAREWHPVVQCFCRVLRCHVQHHIRSKTQPECKIMEEGIVPN